jgi:hypothetical protein
LLVEFILDPSKPTDVDEICRLIRKTLKTKLFGGGKTNCEMDQFSFEKNNGKDDCDYEIGFDDDADDCDEDENVD